jgi:predicted Holliday junction resolvase-like endonuclease
MNLFNSLKKISEKWLKPVSFIVGCLLFLYIFIVVFTPKTKISKESRNKLDSIELQIQALKKQQVKQDSLLTVESNERVAIDKQLETVNNKTTIIREYYIEKSKEVSNYNSTQLDSFFRSRYGY